MNIAAAMAVLRLELPDREKFLLLVLATRAPRGEWSVTRSVRALGADMGCNERTVRRAVDGLRRRGGDYLQVVPRVGEISTYTLGTPVRLSAPTADNLTGPPRTICPNTPDNLSALKRKTGEKQEGTSARSPKKRTNVPVDNLPAVTFTRDPRQAQLIALAHEAIPLQGAAREAKMAEIEALTLAVARHPSIKNGTAP